MLRTRCISVVFFTDWFNSLFTIYLVIFQIGDVDYVNTKNIDDSDFVYSEKFKQKVNFNYSSVHIPVEIYEGGKKDPN